MGCVHSKQITKADYVHIETRITSVQTSIGRVLVLVTKAEMLGNIPIQSDMGGELEGDSEVLGFKIRPAQTRGTGTQGERDWELLVAEDHKRANLSNGRV